MDIRVCMEIDTVKRLVKSLEDLRGLERSMFSIIVPHAEYIPSFVQKLRREFENNSSLLNHQKNKIAVLNAIKNMLSRLDFYSEEVPPNGLFLFSGTVITQESEEKNVFVDFQPPKRVTSHMFVRDNRFVTFPLSAYLDSSHNFGFIASDENGMFIPQYVLSHSHMLRSCLNGKHISIIDTSRDDFNRCLIEILAFAARKLEKTLEADKENIDPMLL
jgi:hypothetical protein